MSLGFIPEIAATRWHCRSHFQACALKYLPELFVALKRWGFLDGIHYVVGKKPPKSFKKPIIDPKDYEHVISFYNGSVAVIIYDANDNAFLDTLGYSFDFSTLGSKADADVDPDQPLCIGMDYNANINWIVVGQPRDRRLNVVKSFYVKFERKIPALVADFCLYYAEHRHKTVVFNYDVTALGSNYAVNDQEFPWVVVREFEKHG